MNLPPAMAKWMGNGFKGSAKSCREMGFVTESEVNVFGLAAKQTNTIITIKEIDFVSLSGAIKVPAEYL